MTTAKTKVMAMAITKTIAIIIDLHLILDLVVTLT